MTIELGYHLDLTSFVVKDNNQGVRHNIELSSHFSFHTNVLIGLLLNILLQLFRQLSRKYKDNFEF